MRKIVSSSQTIAATPGPSGDVYVYGAGFWELPAATKSFGETSRNVTYVWRIDAAGRTVFVAALGGTYSMRAKVDSNGDVLVSGAAAAAGFYTTPNVYRSSAPADFSEYVCRLRASDGDLRFCTYLDVAHSFGDFAVDSMGNVIVVSGPAPAGVATEGSLNTGRGSNIWVTKLNAGGVRLHCARFGGSNTDHPAYAALDPAGNVIIAGWTDSGDFPTTPNALVRGFVPAPSQPEAGFVAELSADGASLVYSTLGGGQPVALAVNSKGEAQIFYMDPARNLGIRRYNSDGSALLFDTRLNIVGKVRRPGEPENTLMTIDAAGNTTAMGVIGSTNLPALHPTSTCQFASTPAVSGTGYMVRLDASGKLLQLTYLQGSGSPIFSYLSANPADGRIAVWSANTTTQGPFTMDASQLELLTIAAAPEVRMACIGNAASLLGGALAPGEIVSLFGQRLGPATPMGGYPDASGRYPFTLGGAQVTFDGAPAPLLYVSAGQLNTVVPFAVSAGSTSKLCVQSAGAPSFCVDVPAAAAAPGVFAWPDGFAMAVNQDGTVNSKQNPAERGSFISLYGTGLGKVSPLPIDGAITGLPLQTQDLNVALEVSYPSIPPIFRMSAPDWAGQAPFEIAGLSQVNVRIPQYSHDYFTLVVFQSGAPVYRANPVGIWIR